MLYVIDRRCIKSKKHLIDTEIFSLTEKVEPVKFGIVETDAIRVAEKEWDLEQGETYYELTSIRNIATSNNLEWLFGTVKINEHGHECTAHCPDIPSQLLDVLPQEARAFLEHKND